MKKTSKKTETEDIVKIRKFLKELGFVCDSDPSAQNLIYSKNGDVILIKK